MDIRGLFMAAGILRYTLGQFGTRVLYRGQRKDWEAQCSLFRGVQKRAVSVKWWKSVERVISRRGDRAYAAFGIISMS